jgi:cell division septation protein DedD
MGGSAAVDQSPLSGVADGQQQERDSGDTSTDAGAAAGSKGTKQAEKIGMSTAQVKPAMPAVTVETKPQQSQAKMVQPALETAATKALATALPTLMVQIATLAHQEDADVLVEALRRKGYAVGTHRDMVDGMVHVRVGPFASRDVANQWRQKLLNDGYNATVE